MGVNVVDGAAVGGGVLLATDVQDDFLLVKLAVLRMDVADGDDNHWKNRCVSRTHGSSVEGGGYLRCQIRRRKNCPSHRGCAILSIKNVQCNM